MTAAGFNTAFPGGQIKLVMEDIDVAGIQLVELRRRAHGMARLVHEGFGLEQQDLFTAQPTLGEDPLKFPAPWSETVISRDLVQRHEPDVMAMARILRTGVSKADKQFHFVIFLV